MQRLPYRDFHTSQILQAFEKESCPLDLFISRYFRTHKSLGSKDRAQIAETVYSHVRLHGLKSALKETPPQDLSKSLPPSFFKLLKARFGEEEALRLAKEMTRPAPTTIRANRLKISRDALLERLSDRFKVKACLFSDAGIIFEKKTNFFTLPEFKEGLFEVQDEGSQLVADMLDIKPGDLVLDFCSGSGGKALALAPRMQGKGQLFLHDVRLGILAQAKKRLHRAGIQNSQWIHASSTKRLSLLKNRMDQVLVDAPCSGTGTMRRNPDMKWRFSEESLQELVQLQRSIFKEALNYTKPGGQIVYATCSLLPDENEWQKDYFLKTHPLKQTKEPFCPKLQEGGMDGFYAVVFERLT